MTLTGVLRVIICVGALLGIVGVSQRFQLREDLVPTLTIRPSPIHPSLDAPQRAC